MNAANIVYHVQEEDFREDIAHTFTHRCFSAAILFSASKNGVGNND